VGVPARGQAITPSATMRPALETSIAARNPYEATIAVPITGPISDEASTID
jgi:hypothetical protein